MKNIVITGSTRGIGLGLANAFLERDCAVTISGRSQTAVDRAIHELSAHHNPNNIFGLPCDVTEFAQVQALWDAAKNHFGSVDVWINNAGIANEPMDFWNHEPDEYSRVIDTNIVGTMNGCKVAMTGMLEQKCGAIYNLEGLGSNGRQIEGMALYGTTKSAIHYLNQALFQQAKKTPVIVGAIQPGMVMTDMVIGQYKNNPEGWARVKKIFNIIADRVETVTPWIADRVLSNQQNGAMLAFSNQWKIIWRFLTAPFTKRNITG